MTRPAHLATERDVQRAVVAFYRRVGCSVYATSQGRASRIAEGLPDLYVMHVTRGGWWHEVKALGGKLSPPQRRFAVRCEECCVPHVVGGLDAARAFWDNKTYWHRVITAPAYDGPEHEDASVG